MSASLSKSGLRGCLTATYRPRHYWPTDASRRTEALGGIALVFASRSATGSFLTGKREWSATCSNVEDDPNRSNLLASGPLR